MKKRYESLLEFPFPDRWSSIVITVNGGFSLIFGFEREFGYSLTQENPVSCWEIDELCLN